MTENTQTNYTSPLKDNGILRCYNMMWRDYEGGFAEMTDKLDHVKDLGMNAVWLQPFNDLGEVGKIDFSRTMGGSSEIIRHDDGYETNSLYAARNLFEIHDDLKQGDVPAEEQVSKFTEKARDSGLTPMFDIAFSHMSIDAPIVHGEDPYFQEAGIDTKKWFKSYDDGALAGTPMMHGVDSNGYVTEFNPDGEVNDKLVWSDIAMFNYDDPVACEQIVEHIWKPFIDRNIDMGFTGIRIDSIAQNNPDVLNPLLEHFKKRVEEKWGVPKDEVVILGETLITASPQEQEKAFSGKIFNSAYSSAFWSPTLFSPRLGEGRETAKQAWNTHGRENGTENWLSRQVGMLDNIIHKEHPNGATGCIGYPGSVDELCLARHFVKRGVELSFEEGKVIASNGHKTEVTEENIGDFVSLDELEKGMREKMAVTMLLINGGFFLYNGDEYARLDDRNVFSNNNSGVKACDMTELVKDINQMLEKLPHTQPNSWATRKFVDGNDDLVIIEKHNGGGFDGQADILLVNAGIDPIELSKQDLQDICDVTRIQGNRKPTIEELAGGMLHTDSSITLSKEVLQDADIPSAMAPDHTSSHGVNTTQPQVGN